MTSRTPYIPQVTIKGKVQLDFLKSQYLGMCFASISWTLHQVSQSEVGCPDLLSFNAYGDESFYWVILQFNSIVNPLSELYSGQQLRIPNLQEVKLYIQSNAPNNTPENSNTLTTI